MNAEAWQTYQTLCGRTVGLCDLHGLVLHRLTESWPTEDVLDLIARIDIILNMVDPQQAAEHGS